MRKKLDPIFLLLLAAILIAVSTLEIPMPPGVRNKPTPPLNSSSTNKRIRQQPIGKKGHYGTGQSLQWWQHPPGPAYGGSYNPSPSLNLPTYTPTNAPAVVPAGVPVKKKRPKDHQPAGGGGWQGTGPATPWYADLLQPGQYPGMAPTQPIPTGSVIGGGGTIMNDGSIYQPPTNPAVYPTGSFLSGSGGVNVGQPYFPVLESLTEPMGFGSSYGSNWGGKWKPKGGGGGWGGGYGYQPNNPNFYLGLNSWNYGE